eukprot:scaffold3723_cov112-Isochrysis_galbana.AAC.3
MLHQVERDERPSTTQPRLAVHRKPALLRLCNLHEPLDDGIGRVAAVGEVEVVVVEAGLEELLAVVHLVVEAHDARDVQLVEVLEIGLGRVGLDAVHVGNRGLRRAAEGKELARHDPKSYSLVSNRSALYHPNSLPLASPIKQCNTVRLKHGGPSDASRYGHSTGLKPTKGANASSGDLLSYSRLQQHTNITELARVSCWGLQQCTMRFCCRLGSASLAFNRRQYLVMLDRCSSALSTGRTRTQLQYRRPCRTWIVSAALAAMTRSKTRRAGGRRQPVAECGSRS